MIGICFQRRVESKNFLLWFVFFIPFYSFAQSAHESLRTGDKQFDAKNYTAAEGEYRSAGASKEKAATASYNLGNALYRQGKSEDAAKSFDEAAGASTDPAAKADALHNLGNAYLKQNKLKEAAKAYENSLRLRPGDADTKRNLQLTKKKIKEEQQKQEQQKQQQDKQKDKKQKQQSQPKQQEPQEQKQEQDMNKQEAQKLLETAVSPEDQKNARKYREVQQQSRAKNSKKDW